MCRVLLCALALCGLWSVAAKGAVTQLDVQRSMDHAGIPPPLRLSFPVVPTTSQGELRVLGGRAVGESLWLRLRCRRVGQCLPFYAVLTYPSEVAVRNALSVLRPDLLNRSQELPLIRAGDRADMKLTGNGIAFQTGVRALQNGRTGETIRVVDEQKRIHKAVVRSGHIVEARW